MKIILELTDAELGYVSNENYASFRIREAARAILFNETGMMALLHVSKHDLYKLPGGGIKEGEAIVDGLTREVREEAGCKMKISGIIGAIIEYRSQFEMVQVSYNYVGKILGEIGKSTFTLKEKQQGFELKWVNLRDAKQLLEDCKPDTYEGKFIRLREIEIIRNYLLKGEK